MKEIIRVHKIATLAWCQVKAQAMLRNEYEEIETEVMVNGKKWHKRLGFDQDVLFEKEFRGYVIQGHIDRLEPHWVGELKIYTGRYPLNHLLAYAHLQANLYCWLADREVYIIFVAMPKRRKLLTFTDAFSSEKVVKALTIAWYLKKGLIPPTPTRFKWKCATCGFAKKCKHYKEVL